MNEKRNPRSVQCASGNQQTTSDKQLATDLHNAVATRVESTLGAPLALRTNSAQTNHFTQSGSGSEVGGVTSSTRPLAPLDAAPGQTPLWKLGREGETTAPKQKANPHRGKKVGLSLAAIAGVLVPVFAITHPTLLATKHNQTRTVEVASADSDRFAVKLIAHDPEFKVFGFFSAPFGAMRRPLNGLHVRNGTVWIDVRLESPEMVGPTATTGKPVKIGRATGELAEDKNANFTAVRWTVDGQPVAGFTELGLAQPEVLAALGQIRFVDNKLVFEQGPSKFSAVPLEDDPNVYNVNLSGVKKQAEYVNYSVGTMRAYDSDYLVNQSIVKRGSRAYYLPPSQEQYSQVSFQFGSAIVNVSGQVSSDRLLSFADTITEATPEEWETLLALNLNNGPIAIPSKNVLIDGPLDEDNSSSPKFELVMPPTDEQKQPDCVTVVFTVKDENKTSCIAKNSTEQFRLLESVTADGVTVVYGVDAPDERDNHVVRVTDAAGDVVAEDVTLDQRNFTGRAFGLALPNDSVAPFTVELFDFDREWYQSGDQLPDTYVRPGSKPLATATVVP
jgi:hypothetical protein